MLCFRTRSAYSTANGYHRAAVKVIGREPSPRALLLGWEDDQAAVISALFPTARVIHGLPEVDEGDWDVLVTRGDTPYDPAGHLFVVAFGTQALGFPADRTGMQMSGSRLRAVHNTRATEFAVPSGLSRRVEHLVTYRLAPAVRGAVNLAIVEYGSGTRGQLRPPMIRPFLATRDGLIIAGSFRRTGDVAECWYLPVRAIPDAAEWVRAAIDEWTELDPERFPAPPDWKHAPEWVTASEAGPAARLTSLRAEHESANAAFEAAQTALETELAIAQSEGDASERALLSEQGDALVSMVQTCLDNLGFAVRNMDEVFPEGRRREDLRVRPAEVDSWTALVEVRGYGGGAQTADLLRMGRFATMFATEEGRPPESLWYIVNQFRDRDPTIRDTPFASAAEDVHAFEEDGNLVVDTRDLLRLWLAVQRGDVSQESARQLLLEARGIFSYP